MTMQNLIMAYLGDAVYELYVREYLINKGISNVNDLQKESLKYVSATSQKNIYQCLQVLGMKKDVLLKDLYQDVTQCLIIYLKL